MVAALVADAAQRQDTHVLCMRSNDRGARSELDRRLLHSQLARRSVYAAVFWRRLGFAHSWTYADFFASFGCLHRGATPSPAPRLRVKEILAATRVELDGDVQCGRGVLLRERAMRVLRGKATARQFCRKRQNRHSKNQLLQRSWTRSRRARCVGSRVCAVRDTIECA